MANRVIGLVIGTAFGVLVLAFLLVTYSTSSHPMPPIPFIGVCAFAYASILVFAVLLRRHAPGISGGLALSAIVLLPLDFIVWSVIHLPAH